MQIILQTSTIKHLGPLQGRLGLMLSCEPQTEMQNRTLGTKAIHLSHSAHQQCIYTLEIGERTGKTAGGTSLHPCGLFRPFIHH